MPQLTRWLTFIEKFNFTIVHRSGRKHSNVDGLSRKGVHTKSDEENENNFASPIECPVQTSECFGVKTENIDQVAPNVHAIEGESVETEVIISRENLPEYQSAGPDIGSIVRLRLQTERKPAITELLTESDVSKRLHNQWEQLEVHEGIVYRRTEAKSGEPPYLQLFVPRRIVPEVIQSVHKGSTGGHFGIKQTLDQVKRRFYWTSWKADTIRFCKRCPE